MRHLESTSLPLVGPRTAKRVVTIACALALAHSLALAGASGPAAPQLDTDAKKAAYVAGYRMGSSLRAEGAELDVDTIARGLRDAMAGQAAALPEAQHTDAINAWRQSRDQASAAAQLEAGRSFLSDNGKRPGVTTLPSGLQYEVMQRGQGTSPQLNDMVKVHYRGTLPDGKEFDSSYSRNEPAQFPLGGVIKCWTEGVAKMKVGGKAKLVCPPAIAYGDQGTPGGPIPPSATLAFEVELLEVSKPEAPKAEAKPAAKPAAKAAASKDSSKK